ncbi:MAG: hypothetical protein V3S10_04785 [Dehalococcoidales bacterium]
MTEELGKIEKPSAASFGKQRKLYLVPLLYAGPDAPAEYLERFESYWREVDEQISNQESKIGRVTRIYHESIALGGEEGLAMMERLNPPGHRIADEKCRQGAVLEVTEEAELANECMDWERCLLIGFISQKAAATVSGFFREASQRRYEFIAQRIDETLPDKGVGVLFIREGHSVQFPADITVFLVAPPSLDGIHRWLRERPATAEKDAEEHSQPADEASPPAGEVENG